MRYRAWKTRPLDRKAVQALTAAIADERTDWLESDASARGEDWTDAKSSAVHAAQQKAASLLADRKSVV